VADGPPPPGAQGAPTPAATVVPLRDRQPGLEVLLLRRNSRGAFGGMWVFPGGQVDDDDSDGDRDELAGARRAAVREAKEEAGLQLEEGGLVALSFWLPPPEAPRRFATWFFLASAPTSGDVEVDRAEIREHRWMTPAAGMEAHNAGEIELAPPTFTTLWWLAQQESVALALEAAGSRPPERFQTHIASASGRGLLATLWEGDAGYDDCDFDRPGPRRRLVMDPGRWRVEIGL
jgi:8-oxo-dGTP pyrophosphatase MutT (NUDIX family)